MEATRRAQQRPARAPKKKQEAIFLFIIWPLARVLGRGSFRPWTLPAQSLPRLPGVWTQGWWVEEAGATVCVWCGPYEGCDGDDDSKAGEDFWGEKAPQRQLVHTPPPCPTNTHHAACSQARRGGAWEDIEAPVCPLFVQAMDQQKNSPFCFGLAQKGKKEPAWFSSLLAGDKGHERCPFCCLKRPWLAQNLNSKVLPPLIITTHMPHNNTGRPRGPRQARREKESRAAGGKRRGGDMEEEDKTLLMVCDKAEEECWRVVSTVGSSSG